MFCFYRFTEKLKLILHRKLFKLFKTRYQIKTNLFQDIFAIYNDDIDFDEFYRPYTCSRHHRRGSCTHTAYGGVQSAENKLWFCNVKLNKINTLERFVKMYQNRNA